MSNVAGEVAGVCRRNRISLWVKLAYTGFVCVLVPYYWQVYGPTNFLYFCDVALFLGLAALWREQSLWASMAAVGIVLPQTIWIVDFLARLCGVHLIGMTDYMFDPGIPLFTRCLSFFHFWLPLFLLWIISRLGYDRRAVLHWTVLAWVLILVCYFLMPAGPPPIDNPNQPVNINYVYGLGDGAPQQWMPPLAYLGLMLVGMPLAVFLPTHFVLRTIFPSSQSDAMRSAASAVDGIEK